MPSTKISLRIIDAASVLCLTTSNVAPEMMLVNVSLCKQRIKNSGGEFKCVEAKWFLRVFSFPSHLYKECRDKQATQE